MNRIIMYQYLEEVMCDLYDSDQDEHGDKLLGVIRSLQRDDKLDDPIELVRSMQRPEMSVTTPKGEINVFKASDPNYPGVYVEINGVQLALVEYDESKKKHAVRIWSADDDEGDPEYTQMIGEKEHE